ncbi:MAG: bifunctional alpha,alpha-trehalose-phosphate synthase (UDP-forming)/trehalose-phosphatase [Deltaproteobacteria bacterium]|nr:bifunctional alpha,alpha-trehalose-phosphate synthase (UDP-forming)/trehalose-phosphatase [Deltaproteobacteria bacterium]
MRLLIVSNRLPVTLSRKGEEFVFEKSVGGLATGLSSALDPQHNPNISNLETLWIGWPGMDVEDPLKPALTDQMQSQFNAYPVFLPEETMENFYHGFCNSAIWPLFHYFPSYAAFKEKHWEDYQRVNQKFCEILAQKIKPGDMVWIHDYHLMLLPKLLREKFPDTPIGFFLHIPFPSFEIFRLLPKAWRSAILEGLLGADLIGFHAHDYVQYFLRCVLRILGLEHNMGKLVVEDHLVHVDIFPMGIHFSRFNEALKDPEVQRETETLKQTLQDKKIILSLDRLDYTKGILNRLQGFENFLEKNPQWHNQVTLILVLVPSRIGVEHYQLMKKQIDEYISLINGKFGNIQWTPILYQYRSLPFPALAALYHQSHIALITPLRDGMNLVAKEYLASRADKSGVLILSEMAGAAHELGEALLINPTTSKEIAEAIQMAIEMPISEQIRRNEILQRRLQQYDIVRWASEFIEKLKGMEEKQRGIRAKMLTAKDEKSLTAKFVKADRKLLFLDYDGTLIPLRDDPERAEPTSELLHALEELSKDPKTEIVLISGRNRKFLEKWFQSLPIHWVAEHGIWIKEKGGDWMLTQSARNDWKSKILPILQVFSDRLPGAFIEEKEYAIAWHFRKADPELASLRCKELLDDLILFTANIDIQVLQGNKVVEIRNAGISKGTAAMRFLSKDAYDFILAIGDDNTDEDLFQILPKSADSIRIGLTSTHAQFNLPSHKQVLSLLQRLTERSQPR